MVFSVVALSVQISEWYRNMGSTKVLKWRVFNEMLSFVDLYMFLCFDRASSVRAFRLLMFLSESRSVSMSLQFFQLCFV